MKLTQEQVIAGLMARGVPAHVAQGVALNFANESGLDTGIQERNPSAGRGGFGLAQWTGPRRTALENFAAVQGRPIDDPNVQLDYFMHENAGPEKQAWNRVLLAPTMQEAAASFVSNWERPAPQYEQARVSQYLNAPQAEPQASQSGQAPGFPPPMPQLPQQPSFAERMGWGGNQDWMRNQSYTPDALMADFFAGHNPLKRFMYQKVMGLFT